MKTLLKFEADWCGPCQAIKPVVNDVVARHTADVTLQTVDVDDPANVALVQAHGVRAIPTLVLLDGEEVVRTHRGTLGAAELERFIAA
ncbi:MAG TPA: thioredoxin family protein [Pseudomonadales bacterium]|nr:thioredoxin family protein [Pseudomonadales bacterium]